jgi:hypothetical protein
MKKEAIPSESITSQKTSLATEKHGKRQKSARLNFSGVKGVVHLSSDYYIIDGDQTPTSKKERLPAYLESAEPTPACFKMARPTAFAACPESARLTSQSAGQLTLPPTLS